MKERNRLNVKRMVRIDRMSQIEVLQDMALSHPIDPTLLPDPLPLPLVPVPALTEKDRIREVDLILIDIVVIEEITQSRGREVRRHPEE